MQLLNCRNNKATVIFRGNVKNNFYALSCPVVFRFLYFSIDLLFKEWDPSIENDETTGFKEIAHMLPKSQRRDEQRRDAEF